MSGEVTNKERIAQLESQIQLMLSRHAEFRAEVERDFKELAAQRDELKEKLARYESWTPQDWEIIKARARTFAMAHGVKKPEDSEIYILAAFGQSIADEYEQKCPHGWVGRCQSHSPKCSGSVPVSELRKSLAESKARQSELENRISESESECIEQARLNGMGSEREAALLAKLEEKEGGRR